MLNNLILEHVSLANKNWFGTGGHATFYAEPRTVCELHDVIIWAQQHKIQMELIGEGANVLIADNGFDGLVIRPCLKSVHFAQEDDLSVNVTVEAGLSMRELINYCLDHNIGGLEEFSGIPGTVGGSVFINIHYFEFLLSNFLISATILNIVENSVEQVSAEWFQFGYNYSRLHEKQHILLAATFRLKNLNFGETMYARGRSDEIIRHRNRRYPLQKTCGSFFRNFHEKELEVCRMEKPVPFVAYYLDQIGVKGTLKVGNAFVSHQHANMIVNQENGTTADIITVAQIMQKKVYEKFSIIPQPECRLIGFSHYPFIL